jgi:PmbA protein
MANYKLDSTEEKRNALRDVIDKAKIMGAESAAVSGFFSKHLTISSRMREIEYLEKSDEVSIVLDVFKKGKKGSVSLASTSKESIVKGIEKALSLCEFTEVDKFFGLPDPELLERSEPLLDIYFPQNQDLEYLKEYAIECENAALEHSPRICNSEGASINCTEQERVLANSHDYCNSYQSTSYSLSCCVIAEAESEKGLERDYWYDASRDFNDLESATSIGERAARRSIERLGARKIKSQRLPILLPNYCAKTIFGSLVSALSGTSQYQKRSFFPDSISKKIASSHISINESPREKKFIASAPFDGDGVATISQPLITEGIVNRYLLSTYSARRLGFKTTGNSGGVRNLIIHPNDVDINKALMDFKEIFVVNEFLGQGVNEVTGDFSRGVSGYIMRRGEKAYPVNEVTIAGNLKDIFNNIIALGDDFDYRSSIVTGSIIIDGLTISGS